VRIEVNDPPRVFGMGNASPVRLSDCAHISLAADEQVTFLTDTGAEYDVARKEWGFYATPSLNGRLAHFGLRGVLVRNPDRRYYVLLVERGKEEAFQGYARDEGLQVVTWLDDTSVLEALEDAVKGPEH